MSDQIEPRCHVSTHKPDMSLGYLIKRPQSMMMDVLDQVFQEQGFSYTQYVVLSCLRKGTPVNARYIGIQFQHNSGALTRVIDLLADRGLLQRVRHNRDRRKINLELTESGRETVERLVPLVVEKLNLALAELSDNEVDELSRLLDAERWAGSDAEKEKAVTDTPEEQPPCFHKGR